MKRFRLAILLLFISSIFWVQGEICLGQPPFEITYAGVTHVVGQRDVRTFFDLGINDLPSSVLSAYVKDPDDVVVHVFSPIEFSETDNGYFYAKPGPPKVGDYEFIVEFTDGTTVSRIDPQGSVFELPVMKVGQVTVIGNHTTTPTFEWEDISPGNYYRLGIYDQFWNTLYRTSRISDTTFTVPDHSPLPPGINLRVRLEVHDSSNWSTLENRSNGETLYLDTKYIPFQGVTHVNTTAGVKTNLDLGINFTEDSVAIASVTGPASFYYEFQDSDFDPEYNSYFLQLDGPPAEGDYIFTVRLNDGTSQSETDTQGPLETLPIIPASQYEIIGGDGVTPTFRWPEVAGRILFYRAQIYDMAGNLVVNTSRLGGTAFTTFPGDLQPNTAYEFVGEVHDSNSFFTLNNRANGERLQFTTGTLPGPPSGQLKVISVPWVATAPLIPHDTYNGKEITFKAIARGGDGTYNYEWDFDGDGVYDFSSVTNNSYDLSIKHTYPAQAFDKIFIARIRVTSGGQVATAEYPVRVHTTTTQALKVNVAIDEALWWMHKNMNRYDSGPVQFGALTGQMLGSTGAAIQAWENQGHKPGGDYENNPYVEDVRRGLNYILSKTNPYPIHTEDGRNPDTLVNGFGLHSIHESQLYETGIVIMALASSGDPDLTCEVGGFGLLGRKYGQIAQDMADFLAFAQNEPDVGVWRGGWRYGPNYSQSDMSVTQWPVIGLEAAESEPNFGTTVPQYIKDELMIYLGVDQDPDGGFGYTSPGGNVARTGAGIACLAWTGVAASDPRVTSAMGFIDINWAYDNMGNLYAMYAVMKGMRGFEPDIEILQGHDWYSEYADYLIQNQDVDGYWESDVWYGRDLSTASGVLILTPEVFLSPPVAVAKAEPNEATPGTAITFDHSGSFHRDPSRTLDTFRWDFDEDGVWDFETDDLNSRPTWIYDDLIGCGDEVVHLAVLEVEDDVGNTDVDDETVIIRINLNNHPPVADGDPTDSYPNYYVLAGGAVLLDAKQSYDPDETHGDFITMWEWDLNNDGIFEASGETLRFQIPGDWEPGSIHTVTLRVTDDGSWASECGGQPNLTNETTILIAVGEGPDCSQSMPSISKLWPPNHKMVEIDVLGVTNTQGEPTEITIIGITQDEPVNGLGDGDTSPDGMGVGGSAAQVRAERSGTGNGRVYEISFVAVDDSNAECVGSVNVSVPHDKKKEAINDGQIYDSTEIN